MLQFFYTYFGDVIFNRYVDFKGWASRRQFCGYLTAVLFVAL
jgi:hypothetical protein